MEITQLDPAIKRDPWTPEEEAILHQAHATLGNKCVMNGWSRSRFGVCVWCCDMMGGRVGGCIVVLVPVLGAW